MKASRNISHSCSNSYNLSFIGALDIISWDVDSSSGLSFFGCTTYENAVGEWCKWTSQGLFGENRVMGQTNMLAEWVDLLIHRSSRVYRWSFWISDMVQGQSRSIITSHMSSNTPIMCASIYLEIYTSIVLSPAYASPFSTLTQAL